MQQREADIWFNRIYSILIAISLCAMMAYGRWFDALFAASLVVIVEWAYAKYLS